AVVLVTGGLRGGQWRRIADSVPVAVVDHAGTSRLARLHGSDGRRQRAFPVAGDTLDAAAGCADRTTDPGGPAAVVGVGAPARPALATRRGASGQPRHGYTGARQRQLVTERRTGAATPLAPGARHPGRAGCRPAPRRPARRHLLRQRPATGLCRPAATGGRHPAGRASAAAMAGHTASERSGGLAGRLATGRWRHAD